MPETGSVCVQQFLEGGAGDVFLNQNQPGILFNRLIDTGDSGKRMLCQILEDSEAVDPQGLPDIEFPGFLMLYQMDSVLGIDIGDYSVT